MGKDYNKGEIPVFGGDFTVKEDSVNAVLENPEDREEYYQSLNLTKKIENRKIILVGRSRCGKTTLIRRLHNLDMEYHKTQSIEAWADAIDTPGEYTDTPFFSRGAAITPAYDADIVCFCHDCGNDICRLPQMFSMSFARPVIGIVTKADTDDTPTEQAVTTAVYLHSYAGDLCAQSMGEYAMTASDLIVMLVAASKSIIKE